MRFNVPDHFTMMNAILNIIHGKTEDLFSSDASQTGAVIKSLYGINPSLLTPYVLNIHVDLSGEDYDIIIYESREPIDMDLFYDHIPINGVLYKVIGFYLGSFRDIDPDNSDQVSQYELFISHLINCIFGHIINNCHVSDGSFERYVLNVARIFPVYRIFKDTGKNCDVEYYNATDYEFIFKDIKTFEYLANKSWLDFMIYIQK